VPSFACILLPIPQNSDVNSQPFQTRSQASRLPARVIFSSLFNWLWGERADCVPWEGEGVFKKALGSTLMLVVAAVVLASCSGNINNPSPSVRSISPTNVLQGAPGFTLSVMGGGFAPQSTVLWNGSPRATLFRNSNLLTATINPGDLANPATIAITVFNPSPGGGTSPQLINFTINPSTTPVPQVTMLSPFGAFAGGSSFTLQVTGNNFVSQSIVTLNNSNQGTSFANPTTLLASIDSSSIASAGTVQIGVVNPPPGGGASNTLPFLISNAPPTLSSLSPNTTATGQTTLSVTVSGAGFSSASIVNVNGSARSTGFNSNIQLTVMLTQADLAAAGTLQMQVFNPPPGGGTSNVLGFSIIPSSTGTGLPELVDIATDGSQANQGIGNLTNSGPAMGMNGRFIAFASISTNLVAGDNDPVDVQDIFTRDTCLGMTTGCTPQTLAVNLATSGVEANAASFEPSMSGSGRFVAFTSTATNLVAAATSGAREVYLRDTCIGTLNCTSQTTLVSVASDGMSAANGDSFQSSVSPDGRYIAFTSVATNLITGISGQQVYLRDTCAGVASGCTAKTFLVSTPDGTTAANGASSQPVTANNGLFVAFSSAATNLVSGVNSGVQQIYLRGTCANVASGCTTSTKLVSAADAGGTTPAATAAQQPSVSMDGRFVAFASTAGNLGFTTGGFQQIFLRDMCTGVASGCTPSTKLVSSPDGTTEGNADSSSPQASNNGQFVAFASNANNLVASDTNGLQDVFVRNTCAAVTSSCTTKTVLASVNSAGQQGNGASLSPAISGDGHFVTFISFANNLVPRDVNGFEDIFFAVTTF